MHPEGISRSSYQYVDSISCSLHLQSIDWLYGQWILITWKFSSIELGDDDHLCHKILLISVRISNSFAVVKSGMIFALSYLGDCWIMGFLYSGQLGELLDVVLHR